MHLNAPLPSRLGCLFIGCFSLSPSVSLHYSLSVSLYITLSLCITLSLSLSLTLTLSVSFFLYLSLSLYHYPSLSLSVSLSLSLCMTLYLSLSVCITLSPSLTLSGPQKSHAALARRITSTLDSSESSSPVPRRAFDPRFIPSPTALHHPQRNTPLWTGPVNPRAKRASVQ